MKTEILKPWQEKFAQLRAQGVRRIDAIKQCGHDLTQYAPDKIHKVGAWAENTPIVAARIKELQDKIAEVVAADMRKANQERARATEDVLYGALQVFQHWQAIALADPNKIISVRRICCRYCHGVGHHYQWRDKQEFAEAQAKRIDENISRKVGKMPALPPLTDPGGYGFAFNAEPHATCPRCRGEGSVNVLLHDTNKLGPREALLYRGVKMKADGSVEVLMHDQSKALENMAKALGMLVEKVKFVDPKDKDTIPALPLDPVEASKVYAQYLKGT